MTAFPEEADTCRAPRAGTNPALRRIGPRTKRGTFLTA
jgi:hypothetical protein